MLVESENIYLNAYPNPFTDETVIEMKSAIRQEARLEIFSTQGNIVATLYNGMTEEGKSYKLDFKAGDLQSGIYYFRLTTATENKVGKLVLIR